MTANIFYADGFDHYTTTAQGTEKAGTVNGTPTPHAPGRVSGQCMRLSNTSHGLKHVLAAAQQGVTIAAGIGMRYTSLPAWTGILNLYYGAASYALYIAADGTLRVQIPTSTTFVNVAAPAPGNFHYYELKVHNNVSAGTIDVIVDGNSVASLTGQVLTTTNITGVSFGYGQNDSATVDYDDWIIADDLVGDSGVRWCPAVADGSTQNFTPLSSTHVSNVDDTTPDDDTTYNHDATPGDKDLYTLDGSALPGSGTVLGVQYITWARKSDVGVRGLKPTMRQAATNHDGTGGNLGTAYTYQHEIQQVNPQTSSAYVLSEITASEFGYKVS